MTRPEAHGSIWGIVAARMGSSRMPGKSLAPLAGSPSLAHIIRRLRRSRFLDGVAVATTESAGDDAIRACAAAEGAPAFSGSADDVLDRTLRAARFVGASLIVQVTGDCPLIDPAVVDRAIELFLREKPDYASNGMTETYPNGMGVEVFPTSVLAEVSGLTVDPADREHVTLYIYEHPERYRIQSVEAPPQHARPDLRLTLDTREDYAVISALYDALYPRDPFFGLDATIAHLDRHPEIAALNAHVRQKAAR